MGAIVRPPGLSFRYRILGLPQWISWLRVVVLHQSQAHTCLSGHPLLSRAPGHAHRQVRSTRETRHCNSSSSTQLASIHWKYTSGIHTQTHTHTNTHTYTQGQEPKIQPRRNPDNTISSGQRCSMTPKPSCSGFLPWLKSTQRRREATSGQPPKVKWGISEPCPVIKNQRPSNPQIPQALFLPYSITRGNPRIFKERWS